MTDTQISAAQHLHIGTVASGAIESGVSGVAAVAPLERDRTRANYSATH